VNPVPQLCVVGHPNRGKSSLVATLTENDSVRISAESGTTTAADQFEFLVDNRIHLRLFDTPGFQRARQVLAWLESVPVLPGDRPQRVAAFLAEPENRLRFPDEVAVLSAIKADSGIVYVVDGADTPTAADRAEMEILQWTGQPRMAVINPMGKTDHTDVWRQTLGQFFQWVRVFNPLTADIDARLSLLRAIAELQPEWSVSIRMLCDRLALRDHQRLEQMVNELAQYWIAQMARREPLTLLDQQGFNRAGDKLRQHLDEAETVFCQKLLSQWGHQQTRLERDVVWFSEDDTLMNTETWYLWGLRQKELLLVSAAAGVATGLAVDVGTGGMSMLLGAVSGGVLGSVGGWWASRQLPGKKLGWLPLTRQKQFAGPVVHPNFPLVVMARALTFAATVLQRTHARRDGIALRQAATQWSQGDRVKVVQWAKAIQQQRWKPAQQDDLLAFVTRALQQDTNATDQQK